MGLLIKGQWHDQWYDTKASNGEFIREDAQYRHWITADGEAHANNEVSSVSGVSGQKSFQKSFKAEANRYHLYVSLACPWAHRTLIFRELKQLTTLISVSVVHPDMLDNGWVFGGAYPEGSQAISTDDELYQSDFMHQIYTRDNPEYTGRVTVPVLWDKQQQCIVNNESADIIRIFNTSFNHLTGNTEDYYPETLRENIDGINECIYTTVNNGVYRAGFATTQTAYEKAVFPLFDTLDELDTRLSRQRYLTGAQITEADWRLFTTLIRFDAVYVGHFKCNLLRISDYPNLSAYVRELYQWPQVKHTVNFDHIKRHYYYSHDNINPTRVVPAGPVLNVDTAHNRHLIPNL